MTSVSSAVRVFIESPRGGDAPRARRCRRLAERLGVQGVLVDHAVESGSTHAKQLRRLADVPTGPGERVHDRFALRPVSSLTQGRDVGGPALRNVDTEIRGLDLLA